MCCVHHLVCIFLCDLHILFKFVFFFCSQISTLILPYFHSSLIHTLSLSGYQSFALSLSIFRVSRIVSCSSLPSSYVGVMTHSLPRQPGSRVIHQTNIQQTHYEQKHLVRLIAVQWSVEQVVSFEQPSTTNTHRTETERLSWHKTHTHTQTDTFASVYQQIQQIGNNCFQSKTVTNIFVIFFSPFSHYIFIVCLFVWL